jgi:glycosyltransferase involved in cell wall biosynthesis
MKIVICYPVVNAYMAACWRALSARPSVDLFVIGQAPVARDLVDYRPDVMAGLRCRLLDEQERGDAKLIAELVMAERPDLLVISGWSEPGYRPLYFNRSLSAVPKILVMDNQLRLTMRQQLGRVLLKPLLARVQALWVVGERAWQYARFLGVPEHRIRRGAVGIDYEHFRFAQSARARGPWPNRFLFVGRYHPRKGLDLLAEAYGDYRARVGDPWPLTIAGKGPDGARFDGLQGVTDLGFVSPDKMARIFASAGAFLQPSRYDAWPLSIVEAAASGLPIVASSECGSAAEIVRDQYNGLCVPTGSADALSEALLWTHRNYDRLPLMGLRSAELARPFAADIWADRAIEIATSFGHDAAVRRAC